MKKERFSWIDIARGIGIILVIYAHTLGSHGFRYLIYSFHMPLFFFLSGLVFHSRKNERYVVSLKKDIKRIIIPYFIFAFISLFLWFFRLDSHHQTFGNIATQLIGIFYGSANNGYLAINTVLWFLPCLFVAKQIFWFISRLKNQLILPLLLIISIVGYAFSILFPSFKLPFGIETALTGVVFFGIGYLWNSLPLKLEAFLNKYSYYLIALLIFVTIFFATINFHAYGVQIDLRLNRLSNYFVFYIAAFSGILATILIGRTINKNIILETLGKKTMVLFVWHYFVFIYLSKIFFALVSNEEIISLRNIYYAPVYTVLAIVILLAIDKFYALIKFRVGFQQKLKDQK